MRTLFKYPVPKAESSFLALSGPVRLVGRDGRGDICVWIEGEDEDAPQAQRTFRVYGTGHKIAATDEHRGSFFDLPFVWHVYEEVS